MARSARAAPAVAAVAIAGVVACVAMIFEAGRRAYETIGPSKAVAGRDGALHVLSHGAVHVFDAAGRRIARHDLARMGAPRVPADFAVHDDGRLVIADSGENRLLLCAPAGTCTALLTNLQRAPGKAEFTHNAAKVAIDEAARRYYVSDNAGHRVLIVDFDGRIAAHSAPGVVWYPNVPRPLSPGELMVVDTNHHRIAFFDVSGGRLDRVVRSMRTDSNVARPGRRWPFDALRVPDGGTWALVAIDGMKNADIVVFDAAGRATRRVDLGDDMDPFALEPWRGAIVVADATRYRLDAIEPGGAVRSAVSDGDFLAELEDERRRFHAWKLARMAAQAGIAIIPLLAIVVLWRLGVPLGRAMPPAAVVSHPAELAEHPHWIEVDAAYLKAMRSSLVLVAAALTAMTMLMGATLWWRLGDALLTSPQRILVAVLVAMAVGAIAGGVFMQRSMLRHLRETRVGASRDSLRYELPRSQARFWSVPAQGQVPWSDVYFDGRRVLAGRVVFLVRAPLGKPALFAPEEFARWIVAAVPPANHITPSQLSMLLFRRQKRIAALFGVILALVFALLLLRVLFRSL